MRHKKRIKINRAINITVNKEVSLHWPYIMAGLLTAQIGFNWHHGIFYSVMDFLFWPIVWIKWLIWHEVNWGVIRTAFSWFVGG